MNILLLTSEFAPVQGGIGTYASEIATAATALGASVTVAAPDYTGGADAEDLALTYSVQRFNGGLHSMRDTPAKISLARGMVRRQSYDIIHAADWPFFIPVALSRGLTKARLLMTVHGTEINETQTPLSSRKARVAPEEVKLISLRPVSNGCDWPPRNPSKAKPRLKTRST